MLSFHGKLVSPPCLSSLELDELDFWSIKNFNFATQAAKLDFSNIKCRSTRDPTLYIHIIVTFGDGSNPNSGIKDSTSAAIQRPV